MGNGVTKNFIIDEVAMGLAGFTRKESAATVEALLEIIKRTLENGEDVLISGFGKFQVKGKGQRQGRNSTTGDLQRIEYEYAHGGISVNVEV